MDALTQLTGQQAEIERLRMVEQAHLSVSAEDADVIEDYEARHQTSLEVIRARERHIESQRLRIVRLQGELAERQDEVRALEESRRHWINQWKAATRHIQKEVERAIRDCFDRAHRKTLDN